MEAVSELQRPHITIEVIQSPNSEKEIDVNLNYCTIASIDITKKRPAISVVEENSKLNIG